MANQSTPHLKSIKVRATAAVINTALLGLLMVISVMAKAQCVGAAPTAVIDWPQYRFVSCHTGFNPYEFVLSPTTVGTLGLLWKYRTGSLVDSSPAVVNGVVYIGSNDNNLYALNASTGAFLWKYQTNGSVFSSPAVANGVVYFGSGDDYLYALDASSGLFMWKYPTNGSVLSSPAVANGVVYFGSDNNLYALDASTGAFMWMYPTQASVFSSPAVANSVVYFGSGDANVYALDASSGAFLWLYSTGASIFFPSPAVANGVVYIASDDTNVYALNASTGARLWYYTTGNIIESSPTVANGVVYIGSEDRKVYAFETPLGVDVLFSDLGPPGNLYQCGTTATGWTVSGSGSPAGSFTAANEFVVVSNGSVSQIDLAVSYISGVNSFYASIWTDNNGLPGTELARWDNLSSSTTFGQCGGFVTITGISGLSLIAGESYFMVLGPESFSSDTWEAWNWNSQGITGLDLYSTDGGNTWNSNGTANLLGAFDILR